MGFELLRNKEIIKILIGDVKVYQNYSMPYLSGPDLCALCTRFGLPKTYAWRGTNQSRWEYMSDLLKFLDNKNSSGVLLAYLFDLAHFECLKDKGSADEIRDLHSRIVTTAIGKINGILLFSGNELKIVNKQFVLCACGETPVMEAPKTKNVTYQYIQELPERIKNDLLNKDYDNVVTKARTLLEEVMIYIIEKRTKERYKSNGKIKEIYAECRSVLNMNRQEDWDIRVNDLINGINKIVDAIGDLRNMNSDAHGAGCKRINIREREARLVASSAVMVSEYLLSVYQGDRT
ncbi:MAG: abortive infection family protein [Bacteroidaceae bacterium]|nr:abortive infection family protein [Bacteroidaceae bacterium]